MAIDKVLIDSGTVLNTEEVEMADNTKRARLDQPKGKKQKGKGKSIHRDEKEESMLVYILLFKTIHKN